MSLSFLEEYGPGLISNGYKIIPIKRGSKAPAVKGWPKIDADQNQLEKWISAGHEGVGILCKNNPAVDIDVLDEEVCSQMVDAVLQEYPGGLVRVGRAPKTLLAYRTDKPFKKVRSSTYKDLSGKRHAVEILADGQQYVAYAIHPDTNQPYQWNGKDIADVDSNDLPIIRYEDALKVVEIFEQIAQEKILSDGWTKIEGGASGKSTEANDKKNGSDSTELAGISNLKPTLDITDQEVKADLACLCADDYKRWINVGMALHHQYKGSPEGFDIWDDWSQTSNKYPHEDPSEIPLQGKWSSFSKKGDGEVITFASVKWWVNDKRGGIDPLEEFLERYIYIAEGDCVHDLYGLPHNKPLEMKEFRNMTENIRIVKEIPAPIATNSDRTVEKEFPVHKLWLKSCERKTAMAFSYLPGGPRILRDSDDQLYINKFNMPAFVNPCLKIYENGETKMYQEEIDSLLKIFFRHIEYIIPIDEEREWFYSWMAFNIQFPEKRCKVTPLLVATDHGTGRGWVVQLMNLLLGSWNCTKTKMSTLCGEKSAGQFQDFMNDSLLCCIEEVKEGDRGFEVSDSIRDYLTENTLELNIKYGTKQTKSVYTNFLLSTNHVDALKLKAEDRRINVFKTVDGPKDCAYYDQLYGWLEVDPLAVTNDGEENTEVSTETYDRAGAKVSSGVSCLFHWLKNRNLEDFNWKTSMANKAREDMIENNQTDVENHFHELLKNPPYEIMTLTEIKSALGKKKDDSSVYGCFLSPSEEKQAQKLVQKYLGKQERVKISQEYDPNLNEKVTLEKPYEVHYWSFDKRKKFSTKEIRKTHDAHKKVA